MMPYANQIKDDFHEAIASIAPLSAADHLFQVCPNNELGLLPKEQAQAFHDSTAHILFISVRAQLELLTLVSFLTKQVRSTDEDDWGMLKLIIRYLKGTRHVKLNIPLTALPQFADISTPHMVSTQFIGISPG